MFKAYFSAHKGDMCLWNTTRGGYVLMKHHKGGYVFMKHEHKQMTVCQIFFRPQEHPTQYFPKPCVQVSVNYFCFIYSKLKNV